MFPARRQRRNRQRTSLFIFRLQRMAANCLSRALISSHGNNDLEVKIEVPRRTNLSVRMFAGQVKVEEVKGDKDIEVGAGQITISSIHDGDYRNVNASVGVGEVQARAFGTDKGGFFRNFSRKNSSGDYRLQAHVTTGEIDLLGNAEQKGEAAKPD